MSRNSPVKVKIPHKFHLAILKVQVDNGLDWSESCLKSADLLNSNTEAFQKLVKRETEKIYKSRFLTQLNKAKLTEHNKGYTLGEKQGFDEAQKKFEIKKPCSVCGKAITLLPNSDMHKDAIKHLADWGHGACINSKG